MKGKSHNRYTTTSPHDVISIFIACNLLICNWRIVPKLIVKVPYAGEMLEALEELKLGERLRWLIWPFTEETEEEKAPTKKKGGRRDVAAPGA